MAGVVVEGPDGAGKTTLIRELRNELGWPVVHVVQPRLPNIKQMLNLIECSPVIFDRFHHSPVVYGKVLRDGPELTPYDLWALEGSLEAHGFVNLVCITKVEQMLHNNRKAPQLWEQVRDFNFLHDLAREYKEFKSQLPTLTYDYAEHSVHDAVKFLAGETHSHYFKDTLGSIDPKLWIVGDERADKGANGIRIPFYDVGISNKLLSGTLLYRAFSYLHLRWRDVHVSNSVGVDLQQRYYDLRGPKVVALGNTASKRLEDNKIPHEKIPHPQWWRRFRHHDPDGYRKILEEAIA